MVFVKFKRLEIAVTCFRLEWRTTLVLTLNTMLDERNLKLSSFSCLSMSAFVKNSVIIHDRHTKSTKKTLDCLVVLKSHRVHLVRA